LAHIRSLVAPGGRAIIADVVSRVSPMPILLFRASALLSLAGDLSRRRPHALELYRLRTNPTWLAHLASDRYLSRSEFESRYVVKFPGAVFDRARHLHICSWIDR
jgi:hypothetical protein